MGLLEAERTLGRKETELTTRHGEVQGGREVTPRGRTQIKKYVRAVETSLTEGQAFLINNKSAGHYLWAESPKVVQQDLLQQRLP